MSCADLKGSSDSLNFDYDAAIAERDAALEKAESAAEAATWACIGEIGVGILGGALAGGGVGAGLGGAAGAAACIAGLKAAEGSAIDAQLAIEKASIAGAKASEAFLKYVACTFHCRDYSDDDDDE